MHVRHREIEAFRFVMIAGTTTEAATLMSISQPAISRLISDLEKSLNFKLFERVKGRLIPTAEAQRFNHGVERYFKGLDELGHIADDIRIQRPSELKICSNPALSTYVLPKAIATFREANPNTGIMIECVGAEEMISRLRSHLAHVGLGYGFPETPGIIQEPLGELPHVCALHEGHPLARKEVITPKDLEGENVLRILPVANLDWGATRRVLRDERISFSSNLGIQNSHTGYALVSANLGVALIEPFASATWRGMGVVTRPFLPAVKFRYVLVYSESQPEPLVLSDLAAEIKVVFDKARVELGCYPADLKREA